MSGTSQLGSRVLDLLSASAPTILSVGNTSNTGNILLYDANTPANGYLIQSSNSLFSIRGNTGVTNTFVGIGTTAPTSTLDVNGSVRAENISKTWNYSLLSPGYTAAYNNTQYFLIASFADSNIGYMGANMTINGTVGSQWDGTSALINVSITATNIGPVGYTPAVNGTCVLNSANKSNSLNDITSVVDFRISYNGGAGGIGTGPRYFVYLAVAPLNSGNYYPQFNFTVSGYGGTDVTADSGGLLIADPPSFIGNTSGVAITGTLKPWNSATGSTSMLSSLAMYTNPKGYLGIGTTNPQSALEIYGTATGVATSQTITNSGGSLTLNAGVNAVYFSIAGTTKAYVNATSVGPNTDNNISLGLSGNKWTTVYAVTGTINTSDSREKTNIQTTSLGLDFINKLNPVSYKWIIGNNDVDDSGNIISRQGQRTFHGFIAQEVKQTLDDMNIDDFAGWTLSDVNDPNSSQGLRYTEFVAPLVKSIQELSTTIDILQQQVQNNQESYNTTVQLLMDRIIALENKV